MNILQEFLVSLGAKVDTKSFSLMQKTLKSAKAGVLGFATIAAAAVISTAKFVKSQLAVEEKVRKTAREMRISAQAARAHLAAVDALGKSWDEIRKDKDLMRQYRELRKLGEAMALPEAGEGVKQIQGLAEDFNKLRMTGKHALQWIFHYTSEYAAEPIRWIREQLTKLREGIQKNMPKIGQKIGQVLGGVVRMLTTVVRAGKTVIDWFGKLDGRIKKLVTAFAAAGAIIAAGPFGLIMLAIGGVLLLLEDLFTYLDGGISAIDWGPALEWFESMDDEFGDLGKAAGDLWTAIENLLKAIGDWAEENRVGDWLKDVGADLIDFTEGAVKGLTKALQILTTLISGDFAEAWKMLTGSFSDWWDNNFNLFGKTKNQKREEVAHDQLIARGFYDDEANEYLGGLSKDEIRNLSEGKSASGSEALEYGSNWENMQLFERQNEEFYAAYPEARQANEELLNPKKDSGFFGNLWSGIKDFFSAAPANPLETSEYGKVIEDAISNANAHLDMGGNGSMSSYTMPNVPSETSNRTENYYEFNQENKTTVTASDPEAAGRSVGRFVERSGSGMIRQLKGVTQ